MKIEILPLPDLLRGVRTFPDAFFDLVREPILQGSGIHVGFAPGAKRADSLLPGFDLSRFRALAGVDMGSGDHQARWAASYFRIADAAVDYLFSHIPQGRLILSFEMPPWLATACRERGMAYLDMRPSPLRFGRDLLIALRCSEHGLFHRIRAHAVMPEELRLEAATLAANVRLHQQRLHDERGHRFAELDGCLVFVGQAPYDASLLAPSGRSLRCDDFSERLRRLCDNRRLIHKPHPFALEFGQEELAALERITGQPVAPFHQSAYQLLSTHDDVELVGISSGLLQEAPWFHKNAHVLYQPFVPLADTGEFTAESYQQIHFETFLSPAFWHQALTPERPAPRLASLAPLAHHHARQTLDQWWDYSKVITWERTLAYEAFARNGGAELRRRVEALEAAAHAGGDGPVTAICSGDDADRWKACVKEVQQMFGAQAQQFGRGQLYQAHEAWGIPGQRPTLRRTKEYRLLEHLPDHADVLDIGCNIGMFGAVLSKQVNRYVGFDNNPVLIEVARKIARARGIENCTFECESFDSFCAKNHQRRFDVVLSFAVHVWIGLAPAEYARALGGLVKPGGLLVVESNRLDANDKDFFRNVRYFLAEGFEVLFCGSMKDDGIIERGFYLLRKAGA